MIESEAATRAPTHGSMPPELSSPRAKLIYLYLSTNGSATVGRMGEDLGMKKISLYSILKNLSEEGLIEGTDDRYTLA